MPTESNAKYGLILLIVFAIASVDLHAEEKVFLCELGVQGGLGYYAGDATKHIFQNIQPAYGAQFRYKFDYRWALQLKGQGASIKFPLQDAAGNTATGFGKNDMMNIDVVAEFNFFRFGARQYDTRIKPLTPYIFLGVGFSAYSNFSQYAAYIPLGIGLKWKFASHWGLNIAWQQQIYFADNLEGKTYYDNTADLNGSNILNNDFTSTLTLGIVFEFGRKKSACRTCDF